MKTISFSSFFQSKRLEHFLIILFSIFCKILLAENVPDRLVAQQDQGFYEDKIIKPQVEKVTIPSEFIFPAFTINIESNLIHTQFFNISTFTFLPLQKNHISQKHFFFGSKNNDLKIKDYYLKFFIPYSFKNKSSSIYEDLPDDETEAQLEISLKELKVAHSISPLIITEKKDDFFSFPIMELIDKQHFNTNNFLFDFSNVFFPAPPHSLSNQLRFNKKLSVDHFFPKTKVVKKHHYFAEKEYFRSLKWANISTFIKQKTVEIFQPSIEKINTCCIVNKTQINPKISLNNKPPALLSLSDDRCLFLFDFPYSAYIRQKKKANAPFVMDSKNFEGCFGLYIKPYNSLHPSFLYYPTTEKATPFHSKKILLKEPDGTLKSNNTVTSFLLTPEFELYRPERTTIFPKKPRELHESALVLMHFYRYTEMSNPSTENTFFTSPTKENVFFTFIHPTDCFKFDFNFLASSLPFMKKNEKKFTAIIRSIEFPHPKLFPVSVELPITKQCRLSSYLKKEKKSFLFYPSTENFFYIHFDSSFPLEISPEKEKSVFTFAEKKILYNPGSRCFSFPKNHKKHPFSKLHMENRYLRDKPETIDSTIASNHGYLPLIQKPDIVFFKSFPDFSFPITTNEFFAFEDSGKFQITIHHSERNPDKQRSLINKERLNFNKSPFLYLKNKKIAFNKRENKVDKLITSISNIESTVDLVTTIDKHSNINAFSLPPSLEKTLSLKISYPFSEVLSLDFAGFILSIKEKYLERMKNILISLNISSIRPSFSYFSGEKSLLKNNQSFMLPKRTFKEFSELDQVVGLIIQTDHCPNTQNFLNKNPSPHKIQINLELSKEKSPSLTTNMIHSQSKKILKEYTEENRHSARFITLTHSGLEGIPSQPETRIINRSNRFTQSFFSEILPPSLLETVTYDNEFNTSVYYSKRDDGTGYFFSIKMKPDKTLRFASPHQHFIFVIDGSDHIKKHRFGVFKEAVERALSYLRKGDSFNIVVAGIDMIPFSKIPTLWDQDALSKAKRFLTDRNYQGFFINYDTFDLLSNISKYFSCDKENIVVLITDGHSFKSIQQDGFKQLVQKNKEQFSLFTATTSQGNNPAMLNLLSAFNHGELLHSKTNAAFPRQLAVLIKHIESLVAKNIHINVISSSQKPGIEFYPHEQILPALYADRPYVIYGFIDELKDFDLILQGSSGNQWINIKQKISFKQAQNATRSIKKAIALQKAYMCYNHFLKNDDAFFLTEAQHILESHNIPTIVR